MTTREIGPHTRPIWDMTVARPRTFSADLSHLSVSGRAAQGGDQSCLIRFFKNDQVMYEEAVYLTLSKPSQLAMTAYQSAAGSWRQKALTSPMQLKKAGFGTDPDDWDHAEVNGKRFPKI